MESESRLALNACREYREATFQVIFNGGDTHSLWFPQPKSLGSLAFTDKMLHYLGQAPKEFPVEAFIPQFVMQAFNPSILPRTQAMVFTCILSSQSCAAYAINSDPLSLQPTQNPLTAAVSDQEKTRAAKQQCPSGRLGDDMHVVHGQVNDSGVGESYEHWAGIRLHKIERVGSEGQRAATRTAWPSRKNKRLVAMCCTRDRDCQLATNAINIRSRQRKCIGYVEREAAADDLPDVTIIVDEFPLSAVASQAQAVGVGDNVS